MKTILLTIVFQIFMLTVQGQSRHFYALIVGIENYQDPFWNQRPTGALTDIALLEKVLMQKGVPAKSINILQNSSATRQNIVQSIENLASRVKPGDVVFFSFSGHGQQIMDLNGDEPDKKDESIVPYDSYERDITKSRLLTDDSLGVLMRRLAEKLGPEGSLLTLIDACHSGDGLRNLQSTGQHIRGTDFILTPMGWKVPEQLKPMEPEASFGLFEDERPSDLPDNCFALYSTRPGELSMLIPLSPEIARELGFKEKRWCGPLIYAFVRTLNCMSPGDSYQNLVDRIQREMSAIVLQKPSYEGNLKRLVLGGYFLAQTQHFSVGMGADGQYTLLNAGLIAGTESGSIFGIISPDLADTLPATVTDVGLADATINIEGLPPGWVPGLRSTGIQIKPAPPNIDPLNVQINLPGFPELRNIIYSKLAIQLRFLPDTSIQNIPSSTDYDIYIFHKNKNLMAVSKEGHILFKGNLNLVNTNLEYYGWNFFANLRAYAQYKALLPLSNLMCPQLPATASLCRERPDGSTECNLSVLKLKETLSLNIDYLGDLPAYYAILQVDSAKLITPLIPGEYFTGYSAPQSRRLMPHHKIQINNLAPDIRQREQLYIIITPQPVDFESIIISLKGTDRKINNPSPLETAFGDVLSDMGFRGPGSRKLPDNASVIVLNYTVVD